MRASLPKLKAGDPLQGYKWALSMRLRKLRMASAGPLPVSVVRSLIAEAGEDCPVCGLAMLVWKTRRFPTVDHIVSLENGGTNERSNLRVICNSCNSRKGGRA